MSISPYPLASVFWPLADIFQNNAATVGIIAVVILIGFVFRYQRHKMWNETVRMAIQKGVPLPSSLTPPDVSPCGPRGFGRNRTWRDLRTGLILIAVAIGISIQHSGDRFQWQNGASIVLVIGIALLVNALIRALFFRGPDNDSNLPPKS